MIVAVIVVVTILIIMVGGGIVAAVVLSKDEPTVSPSPSSFDFSGLPTTKPPTTKPPASVPAPVPIVPIGAVTPTPTPTCDRPCGLYGVASADCTVCICSNNWKGDWCEEPVYNCTNSCNGGFRNVDCSCLCTDGRSGANCEIPPPPPKCDRPCGPNGVPSADCKSCICANQMTGDWCQEPMRPPCNLDCGSNGEIFTQFDCACKCNNGYTGPTCNIPPNVKPICPPRQVLNPATNTCMCEVQNCGRNGYDGPDCTCVCVGGYTGAACDIPPTQTVDPVMQSRIINYTRELLLGNNVYILLSNGQTIIRKFDDGPIGVILPGGYSFAFDPDKHVADNAPLDFVTPVNDETINSYYIELDRGAGLAMPLIGDRLGFYDKSMAPFEVTLVGGIRFVYPKPR